MEDASFEPVRWLFNFDAWKPDDGDWEDVLELIPEDERARIGRFKRPTTTGMLTGRLNPNAKSSLIGQLMLRKCARRVYGQPVLIQRTAEGKPFISGPPKKYTHFNMNASHAGNYVAFGSEATHLLGIDVMEQKLPPGSASKNEFFDVMSTCFTPKEWETIRGGATDQDQIDLFFVHWSLKESYIKAVGIGLGFELQRAEFALEGSPPTAATVSIDSKPRPDWKFELHYHDVRYPTRQNLRSFDDQFFSLKLLQNHVMGVAYGPLRESTDSYKSLALPGVPNINDISPEGQTIKRVPFQVLNFQDLL